MELTVYRDNRRDCPITKTIQEWVQIFNETELSKEQQPFERLFLHFLMQQGSFDPISNDVWVIIRDENSKIL